MGFRTDDLTDLYTKPRVAIGGPAQPMKYHQGTILAWNPLTLENTVLVGGGEMADLPVWGVPNATTFQPGDVVAVAVVDATWAIMGQLVIPGTAEAERAISYNSSNTYDAQVDATNSTTSTSFVDLATVGPAVTALIGPSGRCRVYLSAIVVVLVATSGGEMGFEVSGASSMAPSVFGKTVGHYGPSGSATSSTRIVPVSGLTPGLNTFTAKYLYGGGAGSAQFSYRNIVVEAL